MRRLLPVSVAATLAAMEAPAQARAPSWIPQSSNGERACGDVKAMAKRAEGRFGEVN